VSKTGYLHKPVTIKDIARIAGVSYSCVSRALLDKKEISEETKKRIRKIAEELDYHPNYIAKGLVTGRTFNIGIIVSLLRDPNNIEFLGCFLEELEKTGYSLVIYTTAAKSGCLSDRELKHITKKKVDGFILNELNVMDRRLKDVLEKRDIPFVFYNGYYHMDSVTLDRAEGIRRVVKYLVELGHRNFVYLCHPDISWHIKEEASKIYGFKKGIEESGLSFRDDMIIEGWGTPEDGYDKTLQLLRKRIDLPTALIYHNDLSAIGGITALAENGIGIPDDVSVVGFDNIPLSRYTSPPLTTIEQPRGEIVKEVVRRIIKKIDNPEERFPVKVFTPELIIRNSTGPVRRKSYRGTKICGKKGVVIQS